MNCSVLQRGQAIQQEKKPGGGSNSKKDLFNNYFVTNMRQFHLTIPTLHHQGDTFKTSDEMQMH